MWYNSGWKYRIKITIDRTKVSENLTDFPVYLDLSTLPDSFHRAVKSDGSDIRITKADKVNECAREVVFYNSSSKTGEVHFKAPYLSNAVDNIFYIYYGNRNATEPSSDSAYGSRAVWSNGFVAVYHFGDGTTLSAADSTGAPNLTNGGATATSGKVNGGANFNGSSHYMTGDFRFDYGNFTISLWASITNVATVATAVAFNAGADDTGYILVNVSGTDWRWQQDEDGFNFITSSTARSSNTLYHYSVVATGGGAGNTRLFTNGVQQDNRAAVPLNGEESYKLNLGRQLPGTPSRYWPGKIDEARFSSVARSGGWVTTEYNTLNSPSTFYSVSTQEIDVAPQKYYLYRVYDGSTYKTTWSQEVLNDPHFRMNINSSAGELTIELSRPFDNFGEDDDVKLNNRVDCYVIDKEAPDGVLLYSGYISGYKPIIQKAKEYLQVTVFSYAAEFSRMILRDSSGNTTLTYNSYDPAAILRDVIDKYRSILGGTIGYTASSIQNTNTTVSYTFNDNTLKEVIDKIVELCPVGWYWRVDPDNTIYLKPKNVLSDHIFTLGLEVENLETFRRIEDLVNRVLFTGGGDPALFRKYENTGSQSTYGLYEKRIIDQRVTDANTASVISNRIIDNQKDPEIRSRYRLVDSSGKSSVLGVDIEDIKVGETVKVSNLDTGVDAQSLWDVAFWDTDVWDQTLSTTAADVIQILSLEYAPDSILIEASSRLPQIAKRIEDINRNLENSQTLLNPAAPT